ncbi:hypothetical protein TRIATDRAFT_301158 [Trichoderma atroviride IMI 206040]|uniref:Uncharacterized protein n=1 Tax=Hypocrea atroviridis (strain ATCC 20476 / IMI 206040) TaxID=452589 RepID=G9P118_HYPAI|nr:uncharacterized protein TRIATDRAFT_301158 [Trichoderma atroviride IMI 206040]EHK43263.1 hypothetical protein TRIATDRAFT_301158 [Trichoderma atroviride IMI 206040]
MDALTTRAQRLAQLEGSKACYKASQQNCEILTLEDLFHYKARLPASSMFINADIDVF